MPDAVECSAAPDVRVVVGCVVVSSSVVVSCAGEPVVVVGGAQNPSAVFSVAATLRILSSINQAFTEHSTHLLIAPREVATV